MKSYLLLIISSVIVFILLINFSSCNVSKYNISPDVNSNSNKPLIVFLNCSIAYDSIRQEYNMNLINKIISEGRIKDASVNAQEYESDDIKYCLQDKSNQIISCTYFPDPLDKTIEYVNEKGHLEKKDLRLDSTKFSLRMQLTSDSKYVCFEKSNKQLLLVDLNIK